MPFAVWITGVPGSGKSTIAKILAPEIDAEILRLDEIRQKITPNPTYSTEEKEKVYKHLANLGAEKVGAGKNIIFDATDELGIGRDLAKKLIKNFCIVSLNCNLKVCESREQTRTDNAGVKNLYSRAKKGEIKLAGFNATYKIEKKPFILIETDKVSAETAAKAILEKVKYQGWLHI